MPDAGGWSSPPTRPRPAPTPTADGDHRRDPAWCCPTTPDPDADRRVRGEHQRGWSRCAWCPKASTCRGCRRCVRDQRVHAAVLRAGDRPVRPVPPGGRDGERFLPSVPVLLWPARWRRSATTCSASRTGSLDDDELTSSAAHEPSRASRTRLHLARRGRRTRSGDLRRFVLRDRDFAGTDEEADYLGLPGLLDADADARAVAAQAGRAAVTEAPAPHRRGPASPTHARTAAQLRRELNSLVAIAPPPDRQAARHHPQRAAPGLRRTADRGGDGRAAQGAHRGGSTATGLRAVETELVCELSGRLFEHKLRFGTAATQRDASTSCPGVPRRTAETECAREERRHRRPVVGQRDLGLRRARAI